MKKLIPYLEKYAPTILLTVLLVAALVQLAEVEGRLTQLQGNMNTQMSNMNNDIRSISYTVAREMEEANSLIVDENYELTGVNLGARTATLSCSLTPKKYQPGVTVWSVMHDGKPVEMRESNGVYTAELTVPLFEPTEITSAQMEENGVISTEKLDCYIYPRDEYIPYVTVQKNGTRTGFGRNSSGEITSPVVYNWELTFRISPGKTDAKIETITLLDVVNGEVTERTDIPLSVERKSKNPNEAYSVPEGGIEGATTFYHSLNKSMEVGKTGTYELYAEVTDSLGLCYRKLLDRWVDGVNEDDFGYTTDSDIYDADGNLLYEGMD